jgi:bla regulator protein BlaR1
MESLLIYILKSAGLISLFYILYILLLKNDTSFTANRKFLLVGILSSLVLPAIYFTKKVIVIAPEIVYRESSLNSNLIVTTENTWQDLDWWGISGAIYLIISAFFLARFFFRIFQILKLIHFSKLKKEGKFRIVETQAESSPFSFFNFLFISSNEIPEDEYLIMIHHEKVHARQFHSFDMLASHLFAAILWFNPISWYYKKTVEQNLEFIADHETAKTSECVQKYQHVLVKVTTNQYQQVLVNHFYQSFIKKRIVMLNKKTSNHSNIHKMSLIVPLLLAFMLSFNVKTEAQVKQKTKVVLNNVQFYPDELASAIITKNSTKEQLEDFSRKFKDEGIELQFKSLKYSKEGLLTGIKVKFKNKKTGDSGNYNKSGDTPIEPFEITLSEDLKIEFKAPKMNSEKHESVFISDSNITKMDIDSIRSQQGTTWTTNNNSSENILFSEENASASTHKKVIKHTIKSSDSGNQDVIFINKNGKSTNVFKTDSLKWKNKAGFKIEDTLHVYKIENAKNSSINVISDKKSNYVIVLDGKVMPKDFDADKVPMETIKYVNVLKGDPAVAKYGKRAKEGAVEMSTKENSEYNVKKVSVVRMEESNGADKIKFILENENEPPIIYIDDEIQEEDFDLDSIDPETIKSMMILKSDSAIKKYGEKAKNGVIKITLKKQK